VFSIHRSALMVKHESSGAYVVISMPKQKAGPWPAFA